MDVNTTVKEFFEGVVTRMLESSEPSVVAKAGFGDVEVAFEISLIHVNGKSLEDFVAEEESNG